MTWSLQVRNGDLALGGASLATVTGEAKLVQDLRHYLLDAMGNDPLHPNYGSLFDGGILPNGKTVSSHIGTSDWEQAELDIQQDIRRIITDYQARQLARAKDDQQRYQKTTLTTGEIIASLDGISITQDQDRMQVVIRITTASNNQLQVLLNL